MEDALKWILSNERKTWCPLNGNNAFLIKPAEEVTVIQLILHSIIRCGLPGKSYESKVALPPRLLE